MTVGTRPGRSKRSADADRADSAVDPRLQARRRNLARRKGRRRLWLLAALALVASATVGVIAAANSSLLDVDAVAVVGAERANRSQIITASAIEVGQPLLGLDLAGSTMAVERVPWIESATIERSWDGSITIEVTERDAVISFPSGSRFTMVDGSGRQLELVPDRPAAHLPVVGVDVSGVPGQPVDDDALAVIDLVGALPENLIVVVTEVRFEEGVLLLGLDRTGIASAGPTDADVEVRVGSATDLDAKAVALETVLTTVDLTCAAVIDVTAPSAPTRVASRDRAKTAGKPALAPEMKNQRLEWAAASVSPEIEGNRTL